MTHTVLVIMFGLLLLPGLLMALIPMLPAFWYLLAAAALFGVIDGFTHLTAANLAVLGGIVAASIVVDWSAGLLGAKFGGAAWKRLLYGAAGEPPLVRFLARSPASLSTPRLPLCSLYPLSYSRPLRIGFQAVS